MTSFYTLISLLLHIYSKLISPNTGARSTPGRKMLSRAKSWPWPFLAFSTSSEAPLPIYHRLPACILRLRSPPQVFPHGPSPHDLVPLLPDCLGRISSVVLKCPGLAVSEYAAIWPPGRSVAEMGPGRCGCRDTMSFFHYIDSSGTDGGRFGYSRGQWLQGWYEYGYG